MDRGPHDTYLTPQISDANVKPWYSAFVGVEIVKGLSKGISEIKTLSPRITIKIRS